MGRQRFSRNSNPQLYVAIPKESVEGHFEVILTPLVGWLVSGEESPNFDSFHLVAVSSARFPAERPYAIYDKKMDSWQDLDISGHGLDSLLQHLKQEAEHWQQVEVECQADLERSRGALATGGTDPEDRTEADLPVSHERLLATPIKRHEASKTAGDGVEKIRFHPGDASAREAPLFK